MGYPVIYLGLPTVLSQLDDIEAGLSVAQTSIGTVQDDVGVVEHHWHSRWRVYPQDIRLVATIQAAAANVFGTWVNMVPLNTIPFDFDIIGLVIEKVTDATRYHIQLGYNTINAQPGANMELGERRIRLVTTPIARATELLNIRSQDVPANSTVWARMKTEAGGSEEAEISVVIARHIEVSHKVPIYPAFPW